jgi:hypothetical protein
MLTNSSTARMQLAFKLHAVPVPSLLQPSQWTLKLHVASLAVDFERDSPRRTHGLAPNASVTWATCWTRGLRLDLRARRLP